jgi:2-hydroxychromene-2-carboxylate isomerase
MGSAEFLFDFGSPNAYLAHKVIPQIEKRTGAAFRYAPVLLGGLFKLTGNQSPAIAFANIPNKLMYEQREMQRFIAKHGIPFAMNPYFPVNTLLLMRMATAADMTGTLLPFADAAFRLMWETPKKMDDPVIAAAELAAAGIDAETLLRRAQEPDVKARLLAATEDAANRGAFGAPTFFVGAEIYFGKNTLPEVEDAIRRGPQAGE